MSSILRCALRRLAPAARFASKAGGRGSSGPSFTASRKISTGGGAFRFYAFWDEPCNVRRPETWFGFIAIAIAATYRIGVQLKDHENPKGGAKQS